MDRDRKCPCCNGRGYIICECWPGDCICGFGDMACEECAGTGDADFTDDEDFPPGYWDAP